MNKILAIIASGIILGLAIISLMLMSSQTYLTPSQIKLAVIIIPTIFAGLMLLFIWQKIKSEKIISNLNNEKKLTNNKLNEQRNLVDTVFANTNIGVALVNLDGVFFRVNKSLCELLGYSEQELLTKNIYQLIYPLENKDSEFAISRLFENKIKSYRFEKECY